MYLPILHCNPQNSCLLKPVLVWSGPSNVLKGKAWVLYSEPPCQVLHSAEHIAGIPRMPNQPYTWLGSEVPWLGLNGRLWGHRRLPPWGAPATSSPSNLRKLGQELLLHVFGMNPGLLLLPGGVVGEEDNSLPSSHSRNSSLPVKRAAPTSSHPSLTGSSWVLASSQPWSPHGPHRFG